MARRVDPELSALRALAKRKHRLAGQKVSRIRRSDDGPIMAGTKYDPRRDPQLIGTYNKSQVKKYIATLDKFLSRETQFVRDAHARPVPRSLWDAYKKEEAAANKRKAESFDRVKSLKLPSGESIETFERMTRPAVPQMANPAVNSPYAPTNRKPTAVASERALKKLIQEMRQKYTKHDLLKRAKQGRNIAYDMIDLIGDDDLKDRIGKLSTKQFNILWNYSGKFANSLSLMYQLAMQRLQREIDTYEDNLYNALEYGAYNEIRELISWAETL